jgi:pyruvate/2-oxoglutarate dehydrogenase complex dihydrolipoamide dehydrogenase (E3) component
VLNPCLGHEHEGEIKPANTKKKVAVVGAGPGGLYAAIAAAKAGHSVTVYEKADHAGGNFYTAAIPPTKGEITDFIVWQTVQCEKLGIKINYNSEATVDTIKAGGYESVVLATGANPIVPPIPGLKESEKTVLAQDLLEGKVIPGGNCVVIGGGQVGAETAHFLAQLLRKVSILEMMDGIARDAEVAINWHLIESLEKRKVAMYTNATVTEVNNDGVVYEDKDGNTHLIPADTVVIATGYKANNPLEEGLKAVGIEVQVVGDAKEARKVNYATHEGYEAGKAI